MKIGVFDSGIGGQSVANAITVALPDNQVVFRYDSEHFPYSQRSPEELVGFVVPILEGLVNDGCEVIVIACNTVSTTIVNMLRDAVAVPLIAIEPMIKPAAVLSKTKVIAVCATPTTLASQRYAWLKETYAQNIKVLEPDCSDWSYLIEHNQLDESKISTRLNDALEQGADVIVLGCTHYHWIETEVNAIAAGRAQVIQPETAIVEQLIRVMGNL